VIEQAWVVTRQGSLVRFQHRPAIKSIGYAHLAHHRLPKRSRWRWVLPLLAPHRMAYRTALDEYNLIVHPSRSIYVATHRRTHAKTLSGRSLHIVREPESSIGVGAVACGLSWVSGIERSLLDAAMRPNLLILLVVPRCWRRRLPQSVTELMSRHPHTTHKTSVGRRHCTGLDQSGIHSK
jgi:hypothetical protein